MVNKLTIQMCVHALLTYFVAKPLVEAVLACKELGYLNLAGNTLGVQAAEALAKALEKHPEFKRALWKDLFTGRLKEEIPKALVCIYL